MKREKFDDGNGTKKNRNIENSTNLIIYTNQIWIVTQIQNNYDTINTKENDYKITHAYYTRITNLKAKKQKKVLNKRWTFNFIQSH